MGKDKARDMEIYEETGFINTYISLHKASFGTKKIDGRVQELEERVQELEEIVRELLTNQI